MLSISPPSTSPVRLYVHGESATEREHSEDEEEGLKAEQQAEENHLTDRDIRTQRGSETEESTREWGEGRKEAGRKGGEKETRNRRKREKRAGATRKGRRTEEREENAPSRA